MLLLLLAALTAARTAGQLEGSVPKSQLTKNRPHKQQTDPISKAVITAVSRITNRLVKEGYDGFKALLIRKFGEMSKVARAVDEVELNPRSNTNKRLLSDEVIKAQADKDTDLLKAAQALMSRMDDLPRSPTDDDPTAISDRHRLSRNRNNNNPPPRQ